MLLFIAGIGLVALTGRLVAHAIVIPRLALKQHLRQLRDYGFETPVADGEANTSTLRRVLHNVAVRTGRFMLSSFPSVSSLSYSELSAAGFYDATPEVVHGYRTLAATGLPLLIGLMLVASGGSFSATKLLLVVVSAAAGWILPSFVIRKRGAARLQEIDRRLPELIDVLIATVEAGMGLAPSMSLVSERFQGPIGQELKLTMKRQSLGLSLAEALGELVERCDTPSVRAFVRTAARGEALGVSIGPVLRELSADQRRRHRQAARERMQKAPIKLLFPLMFLIFPALMIVLMLPAGYSVMHNLKGVL